MDFFTLALAVLGVVVSLGALVQTFAPGVISQQTSDSLSALTLAIVGIVLSTWGMMLFLQVKNREGFQSQDGLTRWKAFAETQRLEEICTLYTDIYAKVMAVEKGTPPDTVLTDAQAREKTDAIIAAKMKGEPLPCAKVADALQATTDQALLPLLLELPDALGVQAYETAVACRSLLIDAYMKYMYAKMKAEEEKKKQEEEGFEDLCTEEQLQEKKAVEETPPLSQSAKTCKKPDEVPPEQLKKTAEDKISKMEQIAAFSQRKDPLGKVLQDCYAYKAQMEKEKKEAEDKSNSYKFR